MSTSVELPLQQQLTKRQVKQEIVLVLGVSLGFSGLSSLVDLFYTITLPGGLSSATATLNPSQAPGRPWFDLIYQLLDIARPLIAVLLACHLLSRNYPSLKKLLGIDATRPGADLLTGLGLSALIGIPGLGLYLLAKHLGLSVTIVAEALPKIWWGIPVLILAAIQNAIYEEVIVVGYLTTRLAELRWGIVPIILTSAALRGSYHLYQGFGGFVGNFIMGVIFAYMYRWWGRVMPLIVAHSILDIVSFVGYALLAKHLAFLR